MDKEIKIIYRKKCAKNIRKLKRPTSIRLLIFPSYFKTHQIYIFIHSRKQK